MKTEKLCKKCGQIKNVDMFAKNNSKEDGLQSYCKECFKDIWEKRKDRGNENTNTQGYCFGCEKTMPEKNFVIRKGKINNYCKDCISRVKKTKTKINPKMKKCNYCKKIKNIDEFSYDKYSVDCRNHRCAECVNLEIKRKQNEPKIKKSNIIETNENSNKYIFVGEELTLVEVICQLTFGGYVVKHNNIIEVVSKLENRALTLADMFKLERNPLIYFREKIGVTGAIIKNWSVHYKISDYQFAFWGQEWQDLTFDNVKKTLQDDRSC